MQSKDLPPLLLTLANAFKETAHRQTCTSPTDQCGVVV